MKISTIVVDDDPDDLQRLKTLLAGKKNITYVQDTQSGLNAITNTATIIVTDYFLAPPETGLSFMKTVIPLHPVTHFIFVSSKPTVQVLAGIINMRWGFSFKDKNEPDFEEWLLNELQEVEKVLEIKAARIIQMENERIERERRDRELLQAAADALKIIEGNGANSY